tara:strand:+ start:191 stop:322 length:132 start_codon:yes stop_codon:yes gene_type:complete
MEPLSLLAGIIAIPVAIMGLALLGGADESVRECLKWLYNKVRK